MPSPDGPQGPAAPRSPSGNEPPSLFDRLRRALIGAPRDVRDPKTFHSVSLIAFLAWVGLGADGLSSSSYGPEEMFRALGEHHFLAVALALATALTVGIISLAYARIIEHFPFGGGGYVVSSKLLGPRFGVVSGCALLVDYVLTVTVSVAAGADALFSILPADLAPWKLWVEALALAVLLVLNLRGVKESVTVLTPVFILFLITHAVLIVGTVLLRGGELPVVAHEISGGFRHGLATLGLAGMATLFLRAYSMGAGTYTGIEAVSNGLQIMREPKVETAKRTMVYMAVSLALTAAGITFAYLLVHASPVPGKTMNAVLAERFAQGFGAPGHLFVLATLFSEAALLFVAAQAGFIDGPRVMANMAVDSWLPHRFAQLSDRLTMQDGVLLISTAAGALLLYTAGDTSTLVLMYSINVFLTFSLSQAGMVRYWLENRAKYADWRSSLAVHAVGLVLCAGILVVNLVEKFTHGGWLTVTVTSALVALCLVIRHHYAVVRQNLARLDDILECLPAEGPHPPRPTEPKLPTAVLLVGGYGGLGVHALLTVQRLFPNHFQNFVFVSVGVIDSASMKGVDEVDRVRERTEAALTSYVALAHRLGLRAEYRLSVGIDAVDEGLSLCTALSREFPKSLFFAGKLIFAREKWFQRVLHNETAYQLQRRLQFEGLNAMVLPVRVLEPPPAAPSRAPHAPAGGHGGGVTR